jgi:thymidylate kinase
MTVPLLIVLGGPIGAGKDSVSRALAGRLEADGLKTAVIGLDEIWLMLDHQWPRRGGLQHWLDARRAAAVLTDEFFRAGCYVVIINGPFVTPEERLAYTDFLRTSVQPMYVTLRVSFDESFRRVQGDSQRPAGRTRAWYLDNYERYSALAAMLDDSELSIDTDAKTADQIAAIAQVEVRRALSG